MGKVLFFPVERIVRDMFSDIPLPINRYDLKKRDLSVTLQLLEDWDSDRESAIERQGRVLIIFPDYERSRDYRLPAEIRELRNYFEALTLRFPYWFHYCRPIDSQIELILSLLCPYTVTRRVARGERIGLIDEMGSHRMRQFLYDGMRELHERLGIEDSVSSVIENKVQGCIDRVFEKQRSITRSL